MRRAATKEDIIRTTQELIIRNGIRAVRVDEIAQTLGISKRTLYETFADKTALVSSCLEDMSGRWKRKVTGYMQHRGYSPLQKLFWLINEYIEKLQAADFNFLSDLQQKLVFAKLFEEDKRFWEKTLCNGLIVSQQEGYVLPDTECTQVARHLLDTIYKLRLSDTPARDQLQLCRTVLRGVASQKGIEWIDARR